MSLADRVVRGMEQRFTLKDYEQGMATVWGGGGPAYSGESVSVETALGLIPVYAAVNVIASSISTMPCHVYRRLDRGRERATDTWQYRLLHDGPNPEMAPGQFVETLIVHLLLWGNCYLEKVKGSFAGAPRVVELWPINPMLVKVRRRVPSDIGAVGQQKVGEKVFEVQGNSELFGEDKILHIPGPGYDGLVGLSPIAKARQEIGSALSRQRFQGSFYDRGGLLSGVIERPAEAPKWSQEAKERFRASWEARYAGHGSAGKSPVLEDGMKYHEFGMPLRDQQFIEQGQFTTTQIATLFNMPASKINGATGDSLTYGTREQDAIDFVTFTLMPWTTRIAQGLWRDNELFPSRTFYPDFVPEGLLKGDAAARGSFYKTMADLHVLTPNDIAEMEDRPVRQGGDDFPAAPVSTGPQPGGTP
jgi:HK97 family phage portal protein